MTEESHWRAMLDLIRPHRARVSAMVVVLAIAGSLPLIGPLLIASFIDEAQGDAQRSQLLWLAGIYVGVGVARQIMSIAVAWTATDLAWRVTNELRTRLTRHVLNLDLAFHRATSPGELVSRVDGDVTALSDFVASFAVKATAAVVTLVGLVVVLLIRDWQVGIGLAVYLGFAIAALFLLRNKAVDEAATEQAAMGRMLGEVEERLTGADDLRSNGGGSHAIATFQRASAAVLRSSLGREKQGVTLWVLSNAVFVIGGLIALAVDVALLRRGAITLGTAYLIFQYTQILRAPLSDLSDETERVQRAAGGMARTLNLLGESSAIKDTGTTPLPDGPLSLDLHSVTFTYADEDIPVAVIDDLTLRLDAGTSIGVLGRTGSGKTTLARLLLRLVEPTEGEVRLGDTNLTDVRLSELRARTGVVSQDVHLFGSTLRDNLTLFDETVTDQELHRALEELDLLEARVTRAIDRLLEGRTAIVIAHRLSTVERLDEILVLDKGKVAERGKTADLANDPTSRYSQLLAVGSTVAVDEVVS